MTASTQPPGDVPDHGTNLRSVHDRPPLSGYIRELWQRRDFIWYSSVEQLRAKNVRAIFGSLWFLLTPLLSILVYWLIFGKLLNLNRGEGNYVTFLTVGILMFDLLARSLPGAAQLLDKNLALIRSVYFPRAVIPASYSVEQIVQFLPSIIVMIIFVLAGGDPITLKWLLLIPTLVISCVFMLGLTMIFARIGKLATDIGLALPHLIRLLFYGSGVFYLPSFFTTNELVLTAFEINPVFQMLTLARSALIEIETAPGWMWLSASAWAVGTFAAGLVFFWRGEATYGE